MLYLEDRIIKVGGTARTFHRNFRYCWDGNRSVADIQK